MVWAELLIWAGEGLCVCVLKHLFKFRHIKHFSAQWLQREMPHTSAHLTQFFHHISFNTVLSINTLFVFSKYRFLFIGRKPCNLCYCLKPCFEMESRSSLKQNHWGITGQYWGMKPSSLCSQKERDLFLLQYLPFSVFPSPGITSKIPTAKPHIVYVNYPTPHPGTFTLNFHLNTKTKSSF